jgi:asparagine N-glycosylation enzyme membrane subunit Stt3
MGLHLMRTASYARPDGLSLLIIPAIIYLVHQKKFKIAGLLSVAQVLLHPLSSLFLLAFLIVWTLVQKIRKKELCLKPTLAIVTVTTAVFLIWLFTLPYPFTQYLSSVSLEAGEMGQLSLASLLDAFIFSWLFILIALFKLKKNLFLKAWFGFALLFGIFATRLLIHFTIPAAILAGFGLNFLAEKTKEKEAAFFFLVGALYLIAAASFLFNQEPFVDSGEREAMLWLKENSPEEASVFAQWDKGHPLTYFSQRKVVIDGYFEFAEDLEERHQAMKEIISSSNCEKIEARLRQFQASYIYIPPGAKDSLTYQNGLLEADCDNLQTVYDKDDVKILELT